MNNNGKYLIGQERKNWPSGFESIDQKEYPKYHQIISTLQRVANLYGYQQLQTPRVVDLSWVTHKNAGSDQIKNEMFALSRIGQNESSSLVLVFEHTLSLAKYIAFKRQEINYPFRRVEVGPVYRGERAQKGRKREFNQADIDVIGLKAPWGEVEIISIMAETLNSLNFPQETKIHLNDRKILLSLISSIDGVKDPETIKSIMRQIDKFDKELPERVIKESEEKKIPTKTIIEILKMNDSLAKINDPVEAIELFSKILVKRKYLTPKIEEALKTISDSISLLGKLKNRVYFDLSLTRGLDYYTDTVFEIRHPKINYSLCGGGRYDNLIQELGGPISMAAIGFAFGIDRMVLAMDYLGITTDNSKNIKIAVLSFGDGLQEYTLKIASTIRKTGIPAVILNPEIHKINNLLKQASDSGYSYCIIVGSDEVENKMVSLKNMATREQTTFSFDSLAKKIKEIS